MYLLLMVLLPGVVKRVYNLNNKQLVKTVQSGKLVTRVTCICY